MPPFSKTPPPGSARLFAEPHSSPAPPPGVHIANIDGASRGNPGPAAYAVVIRDPEGHVVLELAKRIGRETNNVAEYYALLAALDFASTHNIRALRIRSDSELLVRQMQGRYKVKSADLKPLFERASRLARQIQYFAIEHVRREFNHDADGLANVALDSGDLSRSTVKPSASTAPPAASAPAAAAPRTEAPPKNAPSRSQAPPTRDVSTDLKLRARVANGALVPVEPLDLPDGALVDLTLHLPADD